MISERCGQAGDDFLRQLFGSARQFASRQRIGQKGGSQPTAPCRHTPIAMRPLTTRPSDDIEANGQGDDRAQRAVENQVQRAGRRAA